MKKALLLGSLIVLGVVFAVSAQDGKLTEKNKANAPKDLCVKPAAGPIGLTQPDGAGSFAVAASPVVSVGKPAPDFEANAYIDGGLRPIKLSDYKGKWIVLCFYPGDFTFV